MEESFLFILTMRFTPLLRKTVCFEVIAGDGKGTWSSWYSAVAGCLSPGENMLFIRENGQADSQLAKAKGK